VVVTSASAKVLVLDRESFTYLLGPLQDIIKGVHRGIHSTLDSCPNKKATSIFRKDLRKLGLLGCGGFGAVELVEHIPTSTSYALKAVSKGYVVDQEMEDSIMNEKAILMKTNSPFIINLYECYSGAQFLYFLLDAALGGELYATYMHFGFAGSEAHARFYSGSTMYALEYLHQQHIIYRDLKPENLLLTSEGRLKLTDMGLSKFAFGKAFTTCGTPDYFSPEMIHAIGHTVATDWWALGVVIFEMMSGYPPFEAESPWLIYDKVLEGISKVWFPPECEGTVGDLICNLLENEPGLRLPMRPGGTQNIKSHPWYSTFDWEALRNQTLTPPFKPEVKSHTDRSNFEEWDFQLPIQIPYEDDGSGWDREFATVHEPDIAESEPPEEHPDNLSDYDFEYPDLDHFFQVSDCEDE
jgi:serine/threonine protein kinase